MATACLAVSANALACKPLGLDTEIEFEKGTATLSASNVRKLAHWHAGILENFNGRGTYLGEPKVAPSLGVSASLVAQRKRRLTLLFGQIGVKSDRIEIRSFEFKGSNSERVDMAGIAFEPECPNPCCPGPEPVESK
ncbi:hypothetical protein [Cupriavidus campinensis]